VDEGFFFFGGGGLYRQRNTLRNQGIAFRGILDETGLIAGVPGQFVGSLAPALNTSNIQGPKQIQPGTIIGGGYRFRDGSALSLSILKLWSANYTAAATLVPPINLLTADVTNTYLFSPVYNFPIEYSGPQSDIPGIPGAAYGVWNGADVMTIDFEQFNTVVDLTYRVPIHETENWRTYGLFTGQFVQFWERFRFRSYDADATGLTLPMDVATYTNIVSNLLYGPLIGCGNECYIGHGFSVSLDLQAGLLFDRAKMRAKYQIGQRESFYDGPQRKRSNNDYTLVPEVRGTFNLWWYPYEGIQVRAGYDLMTFFNTFGMDQPISYNYGALDPDYRRVFRFIDGVTFGIALIF
jgi:hypothetical protein